MRKEERLVLPSRWGRAEIAWPFSQTAAYLDQLAKQKGYSLRQKEFLEFENERVQIYRQYERGGKSVTSVSYTHKVYLPEIMTTSARLSSTYMDFEPSDITWNGMSALIPVFTLKEKLSDNRVGSERFYASTEHLCLEVITERRPGRTTFVGSLLGYKTAKYFAHCYDLPAPDRRKRADKSNESARGPPFLHEVKAVKDEVYGLGRLKHLIQDLLCR